MALCVNAKETYAEFALDGQTYYLAEALIHSVFGEKSHEGRYGAHHEGQRAVRHGVRAALSL